jgi:6-pyruvoyltetrahydropterin/6-carboxytetrahydropterin synthase
MRVHLQGKVDSKLGWIVDFADIKKAVAEVCDVIDHHYLNEIEGLAVPTAENLARWLYNKLMGTVLERWLYAIELFESSTTGVWYEPE